MRSRYTRFTPATASGESAAEALRQIERVPVDDPYTLAGMSEEESLRATMIGCPACAGVLGVVHDADGAFHLACSVGHRFSLESLLEAKEEELEKALWSSVVLLAHIEMAGRLMGDRPADKTSPTRHEGIRRRVEQVRRHAQQLRTVIEETVRPNLGHTGP